MRQLLNLLCLFESADRAGMFLFSFFLAGCLLEFFEGAELVGCLRDGFGLFLAADAAGTFSGTFCSAGGFLYRGLVSKFGCIVFRNGLGLLRAAD